MANTTAPAAPPTDAPRTRPAEISLWRIALKNRGVLYGSILLVLIVLISVIGPFVTLDPVSLNPMNRLKPPGPAGLFGTDQLGRDVFSRVVNGARISLIVGLAVAAIAIVIGLFLGAVILGLGYRILTVWLTAPASEGQ